MSATAGSDTQDISSNSTGVTEPIVRQQAQISLQKNQNANETLDSQVINPEKNLQNESRKSPCIDFLLSGSG